MLASLKSAYPHITDNMQTEDDGNVSSLEFLIAPLITFSSESPYQRPETYTVVFHKNGKNQWLSECVSKWGWQFCFDELFGRILRYESYVLGESWWWTVGHVARFLLPICSQDFSPISERYERVTSYNCLLLLLLLLLWQLLPESASCKIWVR